MHNANIEARSITAHTRKLLDQSNPTTNTQSKTTRFLGHRNVVRETEGEEGGGFREGTVEGRVAAVLAPADAAGGLEVLADEVAALLEVVDALDAVAPLDAVAEDLGLLDVDPLLPHDVLPHLQHRHRVLVRVRRVEVVRRRLVELHGPLLPPHRRSLLSTLSALSALLSCVSRRALCAGGMGLDRPKSVRVMGSLLGL